MYNYYGYYLFLQDKLLWHFELHNFLAARQAHRLF
jgi:hypothetical protein